jgi:hypothetical protein
MYCLLPSKRGKKEKNEKEKDKGNDLLIWHSSFDKNEVD